MKPLRVPLCRILLFRVPWFRLPCLFGLLLLLFSTGCTKQIRKAETLPKKDASLEELLFLYDLRLEEVPDFKGLIDVRTDSGKQGRHSFRASLASQQGQLRLTGFNLFGGTLFDLRLAGSALSLTIPSERRTIQSTREEFEEMARADLPIGSLDLLTWVERLGIPDISPPLVPALEKGEDFFVLYLFTLDGQVAALQEKVWIERTAFLVKRVETYDPTGLPRGVLRFEEYRKVGALDFPFLIEGENRGEKVAIQFMEVSLIGNKTGNRAGNQKK